MEVIVFTHSGHTYKFQNVTNFEYKTLGFAFDYTGVSTGLKRHTEFFTSAVAGYAIS